MLISSFLHDHVPLAFWSPGPGEMMLLAVVALLLYGGNLPEVARSWGKTFSEFRRGLTGFQSELNDVIYSEPEKIAYRDDSHNAHGYEENDNCQDDNREDQNKIDDSEITVRDVNAETIVIEDTVESAEKNQAD